MSYRALLFCPDDTAARLVTQVLSELDFTVELSFEPFVTVKKLTDETFDAVVVDCANEENASLLFKAARNSSLNHSSLCVAVVEGQMGVAKAFRIGANLVLTKPINTEQSKGTLRVARGLLRKSEPKPQTAPETPASVSTPAMPAPFVSTPAINTSLAAASVEQPAEARAAHVPSSLFEAEQDKPETTVPDEAKTRQPMPSFLIKKPPATAEENSTPAPNAFGGRFAGANSSAAAAAPAVAPESRKPGTSDLYAKNPPQIKTAPPLASQDAIVPQKRSPEPVSVHVPTFSSYAQPAYPRRRNGNRMFWVFVFLMILAPAGFFGWLKLQPMQYIHRHAAAPNTTAPVAAPQIAPENGSPSVSSPTEGTPAEASSALVSAPAPENSANPATSAPEGFPTKENIDVGQSPETPEPDIAVVSKPAPLKVNRNSTFSQTSQAPVPPPSVELPESTTSVSTLAGIVSSKVIVPKAVPETLHISQGVSQGLLIKKIAPVYPRSALELRKQGAVELLATISKTGDISKVKVLSGDSMLAKPAVDAVRQWKYRPFLLNAEPVQIETQITIIFKLPN